MTIREDLAKLIYGCNGHHDNVGGDDWTFTADAVLAAFDVTPKGTNNAAYVRRLQERLGPGINPDTLRMERT